MNRLELQPFDDNAALDSVADNAALASYPRLKRHVRGIKAAYLQYLNVQGNARQIAPYKLPKITAGYLSGLFNAPPQVLLEIGNIRRKTGSRTCPMCGSLHSGTLDHVMDRATFPAFSIFLPNLVPACKCNSKRSKALIGPNPGERILHPYFDDVLRERIVSASFSDLGSVPHIETRILLDPNHPNYSAVVFHHDNILMRTDIYSYLNDQWSKLVQMPDTIASDLKFNPASRDELRTILFVERDRIDRSRGSKNNWDSVFISGLLEDQVLDWLFDRFSKPQRAPNSPLV